jgi:hypothetical protein
VSCQLDDGRSAALLQKSVKESGQDCCDGRPVDCHNAVIQVTLSKYPSFTRFRLNKNGRTVVVVASVHGMRLSRRNDGKLVVDPWLVIACAQADAAFKKETDLDCLVRVRWNYASLANKNCPAVPRIVLSDTDWPDHRNPADSLQAILLQIDATIAPPFKPRDGAPCILAGYGSMAD